MKLMKFRNIMLLLAVGMLAGCDFMDCDESSDLFQGRDVQQL